MDGDQLDRGDRRDPGGEPDDAAAGGVQPGGHGLDDVDQFDSFGDDDVPERASEIDDITEALERLAAADADHAREGGAGGGGEPGAAGAAVSAAAVLIAERDEYKALAQRIQADFDNYRRRAQAQAQAEADRATGRLAEALLPVLDAAEAAYLNHPDEVGPLLNQMLTELKRHGLEVLDLDGQPFDPEVADAVAHDHGEGGAPVVTEVLRSGYRWKGRTLRPAMVRTKD